MKKYTFVLSSYLGIHVEIIEAVGFDDAISQLSNKVLTKFTVLSLSIE